MAGFGSIGDEKEYLHHLLQLTIANQASDLHLMVGYRPTLRIDGELFAMAGEPALDLDRAAKLIAVLAGKRKDRFLRELTCITKRPPLRLRSGSFRRGSGPWPS